MANIYTGPALREFRTPRFGSRYGEPLPLIFVRSVEVEYHCNIPIMCADYSSSYLTDPGDLDPHTIEIQTREYEVHGKRFRNHRGEDVLLGTSHFTEHILGLPFHLFEKLENRVRELEEENYRLKQELASKSV